MWENYARAGLAPSSDNRSGPDGRDTDEDYLKEQSFYESSGSFPTKSTGICGWGLPGEAPVACYGWSFGRTDFYAPWKMPVGGGYPILYTHDRIGQ